MDSRKKLQFYRTQPKLAHRAWAKFKDRHFGRTLDACAGWGDLSNCFPEDNNWRRDKPDCVEIDVNKHPILRENGLKVVGLDFLQFRGGAIYSKIILNPPFSQGVKHVLHAWEILWHGEVVAIVNAETVRNPCSAEREQLARLIKLHGSVEIIEQVLFNDAAGDGTFVDVALIHLEKTANVQTDIIGDFINEAREDKQTGADLAHDFREAQELALPNSVIENSVAAFNAAVRAMRESVFAEARASYYETLLGETMSVRMGDRTEAKDTRAQASVEFVQKELAERYLKIKDRAWAGVLRSSNIIEKLSSGAVKRIESDFESIKQLEFTTQAIYGFLFGILNQQTAIQMGMLCDVFDLISKYHTENVCYFKGWKSNDRHRSLGMKIKATRFILPGRHHGIYRTLGTSLMFETERMLADFDKAFALLDSKSQPEYSLKDAFRDHMNDLVNGERVSSSYFDVRFYPGACTIHFYPKHKWLVDRLNRFVGRRRRWLPPEGETVNKAFWLQFDRAEKFDREIREEVSRRDPARYHWDNPLTALHRGEGADGYEQGATVVDGAIGAVLERYGINVDMTLEAEDQPSLPTVPALPAPAAVPCC